MARGTQFSVLIARLRSELRRSSDVAVGVDDLPTLKVTLNHAYTWLYMQRAWSHLRAVYSIDLQAGERYYDLPDGLNSERIEKVAVVYANLPRDIDKEITFEHYAIFDSDNDVRSDPVMRWDLRWIVDDEALQIEVWPIPTANTQTLKLQGIQAISQMVNADDICRLDDDLVVLFAAAELAAGAGMADADIKLKAAQEHLRILTARQAGGGSGHQLGLGVRPAQPSSSIVVRVT